MNTQMVPIATLHRDPVNARNTEARHGIDELAASLAALKQLSPIVVRPAEQEGEWYVTAGWRRVVAASQLGWTELSAVELDVEPFANAADVALAASAAENMVRREMHPVDRWHAIVGMIARGISTDGAASALGMTGAAARRLLKLGQMHSSVIDALAEQEALPQDSYLRTIANADQERQAAAIAQVRRANGGRVEDWWQVARLCNVSRISRDTAIFDTETAGVIFEEDLFAEPGSPEQWTTTDVQGFLAAQKAAVRKRIEASKGRMLLGKCDQWGAVVPPAGYTVTFETVRKRFAKDDPRKVIVAVLEEGGQTGEVRERMANPIVQKVRSEKRHEDFGEAPAAAAPRPPFTKTAQARMAALKHDALCEALRKFAEYGPHDMLRALLMTFAYQNVSVNTGAQLYGRASLGHRVAKLVNDDGSPNYDLGLDELCAMAAAVIEDATRFHHPNQISSSGIAAEWVGNLVRAEEFLPRFDTEDVLKGASADEVMRLAREFGINDHGTTAEVRKRLIGNLPGWKPVSFVAQKGELWGEDDGDDEDPNEAVAEATQQEVIDEEAGA